MFGIGGGEFLVIALVALIAVGPEQLPSVMRKFGRYAAKVRSMADGVRGEFMSGMEELDPVKWTGDGSDQKPIVPRGFAESAKTTLGTPVAKPKSTPMASNEAIGKAFGTASEQPLEDTAAGVPTGAEGTTSADERPAAATVDPQPVIEPEPTEPDPATLVVVEETSSESASGETLSDETVPGATLSDETLSDETLSDETMPGESSNASEQESPTS